MGVSVKEPEAGALDLMNGAGDPVVDAEIEGLNTGQHGSRDLVTELEDVGKAVLELVPDCVGAAVCDAVGAAVLEFESVGGAVLEVDNDGSKDLETDGDIVAVFVCEGGRVGERVGSAVCVTDFVLDGVGLGVLVTEGGRVGD